MHPIRQFCNKLRLEDNQNCRTPRQTRLSHTLCAIPVRLTKVDVDVGGRKLGRQDAQVDGVSQTATDEGGEEDVAEGGVDEVREG